MSVSPTLYGGTRGGIRSVFLAGTQHTTGQTMCDVHTNLCTTDKQHLA